MEESKRQDTRAALVNSAERLIAEKGLGSVSVKMITKAAGARNLSAVHYHFGSIESLIKEVFAERYRAIEAKRVELLETVSDNDPQLHLLALLEAAIEPFMESCLEEDGRIYVNFCLQFTTDPRFDYAQLIAENGPGSLVVLREKVIDCLKHIPLDLLVSRMRHAFMISLVQAADYAAKVEGGTARPLDEAVHEAASCLAAYLSAPLK